MNRLKISIILFCVLVIFSNGCGRLDFQRDWPNTDFSKRTVSLDDFLILGAFSRDAIPSIDKPQFISVRDASIWTHDNEPVIVIEHLGVVKAYPLQIMLHHEIVNDTLAELPIVVTFCPLCNSSIVFIRKIGDRELSFGVTGTLRYSDLVMYDRETESWWQQFTGEGIVGEYAGKELTQLDSAIIAFSDFAKAHPNGKVLSRDTGYDKPYGDSPFAGFDNINDSPFKHLFKKDLDPRVAPMEKVLGITIAGKTRVYTLTLLRGKRLLNTRFNNTPIVIFSRDGLLSVSDEEEIANSKATLAARAYSRKLNGETLSFELRNKRIFDSSGSEWNILGQAVSGPLRGNHLKGLDGGIHFAFAWLAFRPESEVIQ